jgi:arabinofuranosyltransferase
MLFDTAFFRKHGLFCAGLLFFLFIFFKNAWVADDAYISFRSIEQVFAGHGPRWNIDERVQVYTSPLWFGLLLVTRLFTDNLFLSAIVLSALYGVGVLVIARKLIRDDLRWLCFVLLMTGAWAIMDFSSSGLENPLLYLLFSAFILGYANFFGANDNAARQAVFKQLAIVCGLLLVARHDALTLVLLPVAYVAWRMWKISGARIVIQQALIACLPLLCWTIFSVIYYGVPFPNTAYAKILHGIPRADLMDFGKLYLTISLKFDLFSMLALSALLIRILWKREAAIIFLGLGVLLNFFYVMFVGGDFMQGRFISEAILFASLAVFVPAGLKPATASKTISLAFAGALAVLMLWIYSPLKLTPDSGFDQSEGRRHYSWHGILNERNFYFLTNSLWAYIHRDEAEPFPNHKWCQMGIHAREQNKQASDFGGIGMYGYCAGLNLIVIDNLALGEPFFARLPKTANKPWRAGHFHRDAPRGYLESRLSGENHIVDPQLAALWTDIHLLVHAPLFTTERWQAIWRVNTGTYRNIGAYYQADIAAQMLPSPAEKDNADTLSD